MTGAVAGAVVVAVVALAAAVVAARVAATDGTEMVAAAKTQGRRRGQQVRVGMWTMSERYCWERQ